tara:strand:- start:1289 stop:1531 length:243 start_codon:yes stop_codon:yes gene_type:complete
MITSKKFLFSLGGLTFLFVFSWFKDATIEVFKKDLASNDSNAGIWSKLFKVFLVDWLVCVLGVLGTGILFVIVFNVTHSV